MMALTVRGKGRTGTSIDINVVHRRTPTRLTRDSSLRFSRLNGIFGTIGHYRLEKRPV